jgi:hypothetical protein
MRMGMRQVTTKAVTVQSTKRLQTKRLHALIPALCQRRLPEDPRKKDTRGMARLVL